MTRPLALAALFLAACGPLGSAAAPPAIASAFDADTDGWFVQGYDTDRNDYTGPSMWHKAGLFDPTGGDPGGALLRHDFFLGVGEYFEAPAKFLGARADYYGATLRFALRESHADSPFAAPLVILDGGGHRWRFDGAAAPTLDWTSYEIPIAAGAGWSDLANGSPATEEELRATLGALTGLHIRGEFSNAIDDSWLDDVALGF